MVAIFAFFLAVAYDAPWYVFVIGFLCLIMDSHG
jgi:hypothetical protein